VQLPIGAVPPGPPGTGHPVLDLDRGGASGATCRGSVVRVRAAFRAARPRDEALPLALGKHAAGKFCSRNHFEYDSVERTNGRCVSWPEHSLIHGPARKASTVIDVASTHMRGLPAKL